jgi:hypothetical protein
MNQNETKIADLMTSVQKKYFPELQDTVFEVVYDESFEGALMGRALFGKVLKVILHYSDVRILEPKYRMGLVPVISHELAHYLDPVDPERIMQKRLPVEMMNLWQEFLKEGYAVCSMAR